jgi:alkanesulfonate monooxygenase SsuD/methylene tetrahydromethanopterin reductase-like flavin-dependent oxidoreductase (luciferase family)
MRERQRPGAIPAAAHFREERPLRFSIELTPHRWSGSESAVETAQRTVGLAIEAERAGFDSAWLSEDPDAWDAMAMLAAIAVSTERIGLATGVVNPFYRHPAQIAAAVSTLDRLSGGRFRLGLGRGQTEWYGRALGMAVDRPLDRLEETIELLHQWWAKDHRASSLGPFSVSNWARSFGPLSKHVPILLAAAGPKAIDLAGRRADGVIFNDMTSPSVIESTIATASAAAERAGHDPRALIFVARPIAIVTGDPEPVVEKLKDRIAMINSLPGMDRLIAVPGFDVPRIMADVRRVMGTDEVLARGGAFADLRAAADFEAARRIIPTELVIELAFVGSVAIVAKKLQYLANLGVNEVVLRRNDLPPSREWAGFLAQWRSLG